MNFTLDPSKVRASSQFSVSVHHINPSIDFPEGLHFARITCYWGNHVGVATTDVTSSMIEEEFFNSNEEAVLKNAAFEDAFTQIEKHVEHLKRFAMLE